MWAVVEWRTGGTVSTQLAVRDGSWILGWSVVLGFILYIRSMLSIGLGPSWSPSTLLAEPDILAVLGKMVVNMMVYLQVMFFPWHLSVYYPPSPPILSSLVMLTSLAFVALCLVISGKSHRFAGYISLVWVLVFLLPVSGIVGLGLSVIAERFCYLPSVGVALAAGYGMGILWSKQPSRHLLKMLVLIIFIFFSVGSWFHSMRWKNDVILFENAVKAGPVPNMYYNLGNAYTDAGEYEKGIAAFEEAVRLEPSYTRAMLNMAAVYIRLADHQGALEILSTAEKKDSGDPLIWSNKGAVLDILGRSDLALEAYYRAAELDPSDPVPSYHAGNLLFRLKRLPESEAAYRKALESDSAHLGSLTGLGRVLEAVSKKGEAEAIYLTAIELYPGNVSPYLGLGRILLTQGKNREATLVYGMAFEIAPLEPLVHRGIVIAAHRSGNRVKAMDHIESLKERNEVLVDELVELFMELDSGKGD